MIVILTQFDTPPPKTKQNKIKQKNTQQTHQTWILFEVADFKDVTISCILNDTAPV